MTQKPLLQIRDIKKVYKGAAGKIIHALKGVSLDIEPGEVIGLLGVNGAGKTTLASIIVTLHPPSAGDILFDGKSIYEDLYNYRRMIGFCPPHILNRKTKNVVSFEYVLSTSKS